jgi:hypothetical protein
MWSPSLVFTAYEKFRISKSPTYWVGLLRWGWKVGSLALKNEKGNARKALREGFQALSWPCSQALELRKPEERRTLHLVGFGGAKCDDVQHSCILTTTVPAGVAEDCAVVCTKAGLGCDRRWCLG